MSRRESDLVRLVDAYGTMRAYDEVAKTCNLLGFRGMCEQRRLEYMAGLRKYARRYCGGDTARAMDDVIVRYSQMTIWSD